MIGRLDDDDDADDVDDDEGVEAGDADETDGEKVSAVAVTLLVVVVVVLRSEGLEPPSSLPDTNWWHMSSLSRSLLANSSAASMEHRSTAPDVAAAAAVAKSI